MSQKVSFSTLNQMSVSDFTKLLGGIFEHSPWIAERAAGQRPFASVQAVHQAMVAEIEAAGAEPQLKLIKAHPELAGKLAMRGELTEESTKEQSGAGLNLCSPEEFEKLQALNNSYGEKFSFPFIVAVRGHTRHSIINLFEQRLRNSREAELKECLQQIYQIGKFRLEDLLETSA